MGDYVAVTGEIIERLLESRLYERSESIDVAVLGAPADQAAIEALVRPHKRFRISYRSERLDEYEFPALGLLQDACRGGSGYVYYLHTKGVSRGLGNQHARYWRTLMLDVVVDGHEECIVALADHDAAGTNWRGNHYSGNFWWARSEHIARLPDIRSLRRSPRLLTRDPVWNIRLQCELWIGMARGRFANIGVRELDLYGTIRWTRDASDVVNALLEATGGSRYLEAVVNGASPYRDRVQAASKRVVDLGPSGDAPIDQGLAAAADDGPFDVILVDCWHEESLCRSVIEASLGLLSTSGAIVVHDSNPPTDWHARPSADFRPGEEWTGDVWRAVVRFRAEHPDLDVRTVDTDWGCTVIRPSVAARDAVPAVETLDWSVLQSDRQRLLNIVSMNRFRRDLYATPFRTRRSTISSRAELINCLISFFSYERYLEIGVEGGENFERVIAPVRHGVDPDGATTFGMTSAEFFKRDLGCRTYDLVFVDALHEEEACLHDLEGALRRLADGGTIVVHDANPPTEWHQRPVEDYAEGEPWNGTVWRAIVRFRMRHPELRLVTLDVDWGCAVIRPSLPATAALPAFDALTWEAFDRQRVALLNLVPATWDEIARLDDAGPDDSSRAGPMLALGDAVMAP
jgi:predicted O-methyltransferase YrrM